MKKLFLLITFFLATSAYCNQTISIVSTPDATPRIQFGIERLSSALQDAGYEITKSEETVITQNRPLIVIGTYNKSPFFDSISLSDFKTIKNGEIGNEGFILKSKEKITFIAGGGDSGTLYGCLELIDRIEKTGTLYHET